MPSPWDSLTETLSRLTQPVRSWGGNGVMSNYVVPPAQGQTPASAPQPTPIQRPSSPISPVPSEQMAEQRGFISPMVSNDYSQSLQPGYEAYSDFPELPPSITRELVRWLFMDLLGLTDER